MSQSDNRYVVGIDIGGQTSKIGVVRSDGSIAGRRVIRTDGYGTDAASFVTDLACAVKQLLGECGDPLVEGVGVGAPNANYFSGCIVNASNISWASGTSVPLAQMLSSSLGGVKVSLTNDANAAAIGEMAYGAARGMKDFIEITLGTGLGSGIVCGGQLVYGHDGNAGELGHVCIDHHDDARLCGCGRRGCLEAYASSTGVTRTAREWLNDRPDDPSPLRYVEHLNSKAVYDAAILGDPLANEIFQYTGKLLGRAFADFVAFSAPEAIILFGGLARAGELLRGPVVEAMEKNLMEIWKGKIKVLFSTLPESDAAILGASALGWNNLLTNNDK